MQTMRTQLEVIGGGPAGVCAAIAAAQHGVQTALVTDRPVLGGNSSSEIRVWTRGATSAGNLWAEEMGVWGELKLENLYRNSDANPVFWDETLLDAVLREKNLTLLLNTEIYEVELDGGRVAALRGVQQSSERQFHIEADYFIDATGDGTVSAKAGVPFSVGNGNLETLGNSILYYTRREDHPVSFIAPDYAYDMSHIEKILGCGGRIINERMSGSDCWWFEYGGLRDTISNAQDIALELRRLVLGVWNYVKNSGKFHADCYTLDWIGGIPGKRESRRMQTEYCLTEQDILAQRTFPDGAFYGGWYVDTHPSGGMYDSSEENCVQTPVNVYQIPLRCLYNRQVPNLLFAGRIIGVERSVFFSSRVMNTCALSGQAAGTLAAECLRTGKTPAELDAREIEAIRRTLARDDMLLPGAAIDDPDDLAKRASVSANSVHPGHPGGATGEISLKDGGFITFPAVRGKRIQIEVCAEQATTLRARCALAKLPNRLNIGAETTERRWALQPGLQMLEAEITDEDQFCLWSFEANPLVSLAVCERARIGFLCGQTGEPAVYEPRAWYPDVAFALLNGAEDTPAKAVNGNVSSLLPNAQQIGWIAGALAGLMTESGKLGFIGGMELDTTKGKIAGFEEAAKYVAEQEGKTVELLNVPYANSFSDAPKGKEFATELIAQGADVFFGDASAVDSGACEAIDAANAAAGEVKIYDIGQPADILGQNECIICSQVTDNSAMIVASMQAVIDGTFGGATLYGTLQNNALSAGALSDLVPADVQEKYLAYIDQMIAGTFMQ